MRAQIIFYLAFAAATLFPIAKIYQRAGLNYWFSLLVFIPFVGIYLCAYQLMSHQWNLPKESEE